MSRRAKLGLALGFPLLVLYLFVAWLFPLPPFPDDPDYYRSDGRHSFYSYLDDTSFTVEFREGGRFAKVQWDNQESGWLPFQGTSWVINETYSDDDVTLALDPEALIYKGRERIMGPCTRH